MDFMTHLEENYQPAVAQGYKRDFRQFANFLEERQQRATEVRKSDIGEYIIWLREQGAKETTINKKLSLVRQYYKFLRIQRVMLENPFEEVPQLKIYRTEKNVTTEQKQALIESAENKRDRLILTLLITEKIKPVEMIQLKKSDLDYNKQMAIFGTKAVSVSEGTLELLKEASVGENEHILTNQHGKPLKESGLYFILNKYLKLAGDDVKPTDLLKM